MIATDELDNFEVFRDCLSTSVIARLVPASTKSSKKRASRGRKNEVKPVAKCEDERENDVTELSEFIEYLAEETFLSLPDELRTLSYAVVQDSAITAGKYELPLNAGLLATITRPMPLSIPDSLCSYGLVSEPSDLERFLDPVLSSYISTVTAPPPEHTPAVTATRSSECEICGREHVPLTYHHLIPRQIHAKAIKRGWHKDWELNKVVSQVIRITYLNSDETVYGKHCHVDPIKMALFQIAANDYTLARRGSAALVTPTSIRSLQMRSWREISTTSIYCLSAKIFRNGRLGLGE